MTKKGKARLVLASLMTLFCWTASATEYITDVMLVGAYAQADYNNLVARYTSQGWKATNWDLNHGIAWGSGDAILLLYKTAESNDGYNHEYITDFYIQNRSAANTTETLNYMGRTYNLVPVSDDSDDHFKGQYGDLNSHTGASTDPIHLYYTKETFADNRVITGITFNDTKSGGVGCEGNTKTGYDLNAGCSDLTSQEIYMHLTTATVPVKDCYISEVKLVGAATSDDLDTYLNRYAVDGWKAIDYDLNKGVNWGDGEAIYLLYKTTISPDGLNHGYITDFYIQNRSTANTESLLYYDSRTYQIVQYVGSDHFVRQMGDLNSGTGASTEPIHLYCTTDRFYTDGRTVNGIYFNATQSGAVGKEGGSTGFDLNAGCSNLTSQKIYMHLTTASTYRNSPTQSCLDLYEAQPRGFKVKGWAFNPDEPDAELPVRVEMRNADNQVYQNYHFTTNILRADVNDTYHLTGEHGFDNEYFISNIPAGTYTIRVFASNLADGEKQVGGDNTLTITRSEPQGHLDVFEPLPRGFKVQGWAYDPDDPTESIHISVTVARENHTVYKIVNLTTDVLREDVNKAKGITGNHGFSVTVPVGTGNYTVSVMAYDNTYDSDIGLGGDYSLSIRDLTGSGTASNPYVISNEDDWKLFATLVKDEANSFSNKTVALTADVSASWVVGTSDRPFQGTFDGGGNTLTVNINSTEPGAAPFRYVDGATIKNLKVAGTVTGGNNHASGLIGFCNGTTTISDCVVSANVVGTGYAGGLVGHGASSTLTIQNCGYDGTISGFNAFAGGLVGWCEDATLNISNSVFAGSFTPSGSGKYHPIACKNAPKTPTANVASDVYYNKDITATATDDNIISGADGKPVSTTCIDGSWDYPVKGGDGRTYYVIPTGKRLPYSYGFENDNYQVEGWTISYGRCSNLPYIWELAPAYTCDGSIYCFGFSYAQFDDVFLLTPELDDRSAITMSFYYQNTDPGLIPVVFQVGYSSTTKDLSAFSWDAEISFSTLYTWHKYERTFPKGTKYIAIKSDPNNGRWGVDNFRFTACTAPSPASISLTDLTDESAILTWGAPDADKAILGYAYQYKKSSDAAWTAEIQTTATSATLKDLLPNTDYSFRVKTIYQDEESIYLPTTFITGLGLPYEMGFENGLERWRVVNTASTTEIQTRYKHEGENSFRFDIYHHNTGDPNQYLISPRFGGRTSMKVSFYHRAWGTDEPTLKVGYSTTTTDPANFTWVSNVSTAYNLWNRSEVTLPIGTRYVAIKFDSPTADHVVSALVDDFCFDVSSSYASPTDLAINNVTDKSVMVSWTPTASATGYAYQYRKLGDTSWSTLTEQSATSVNLSGLQANTDYDFRVRALYADGNYSSFTSFRVVTDNVPISLPYTDGFENGMGGWRLIGDHADNTAISPYAKNNGDNGFQIYQSLYVDQYLVSPCLDSSNGELAVSFQFTRSGGVDYSAGFYVGYSKTTRDLSAFNWGEMYLCVYPEWNTYNGSFPAGTKYIAIRVKSQSEIMYLDDFKFTSYAPPAVPTQLAVSDVLATKAKISWKGQDADKFYLRLRKTTFFEDFENGMDRWTFKREGEGDASTYWQVHNLVQEDQGLKPHSGSCVAMAKTFNESYDLNNKVDNWLISPKVSLDGTLKFWMMQSGNYKEYFEVRVSTTTTSDIKSFSWFVAPEYNDNYQWCEVSIDLSSLKGAEGYIAFRVYDKDKYFTAIDDISITQDDDWTTNETTGESTTIVGLEPNTSYAVQVAGFKDISASDWSLTSLFTTTGASDITLADNADNRATLIKHDKNLTNVTLADRTLYKDGQWNTLCLPFDLADLTGTPLEGAIVKTLADASLIDGKLTIDFTDGTINGILAGYPFIVKWENASGTISNPVFNGVTIRAVSSSLSTDCLSFVGLHSPLSINGEDRSILYIGSGNKLYYPNAAMTIGSCRAYFQLADGITVGDPVNGIKEFQVNFGEEGGTTGVASLLSPQGGTIHSPLGETEGALWYSIDGRKIDGEPMKRGLYLGKGRKVVIK